MAEKGNSNWQVPREDRAEQDTPANRDDENVTDSQVGPRGDADEADLLEQSREVPEDEYREQ